jgi:hypothetical protein
MAERRVCLPLGVLEYARCRAFGAEASGLDENAELGDSALAKEGK